MSGTGLNRYRCPDDLLNRASTGVLGKPIVIGRAWEIGRAATFEIKHQKWVLEVVMPSRNEGVRARARLQLETPVSDDTTLLKMQEQAADYVREAKRRNASERDELLSSVIDAVARDYFRHVLRKHRRDASRLFAKLP
jgi:hypothetical protein